MKLINIIVLAFLIQACSVAKTGPIIYGVPSNGLEESDSEFVVLNNGEVVKGDIKLKGFIVGKVQVNDKTFTTNEIIAYQNDGRYLRKVSGGTFVPRVIKGRINCYYVAISETKITGNSDRYHDSYYFSYIQKGEKDTPVRLEESIFKNMISDYKPALDKFIEYENMSKKERKAKINIMFTEIAKIYNKQ